MRQDEGNKLFAKLAVHLSRLTWTFACTKPRHTHTQSESTNQAEAMQLQLTNATTTSFSKKRPISSSKTKFGTALFILLSQSRDGNGNGSRSGNAKGNQAGRSIPPFDVSLSLLLSLFFSVDLPVALLCWFHCCCNLVTLCFIFITHTKLLHIKKVKFSVRSPSLFQPLLLLCFALL